MTKAEREYYDRRAPEYDDWYLGAGLFADRDRPGWHEEVDVLRRLLQSLAARSVLDVACGTAFLTQHIAAPVVAMDQSPAMLRIARTRMAGASLVEADALLLPFADRSFDSLLSSHFYGHLAGEDRIRFVAEARRVARRAVIIDAALREGVSPEEMQTRRLQDGSSHTVYKRFFTSAELIAEWGGGVLLHEGRWFVVVAS